MFQFTLYTYLFIHIDLRYITLFCFKLVLSVFVLNIVVPFAVAYKKICLFFKFKPNGTLNTTDWYNIVHLHFYCTLLLTYFIYLLCDVFYVACIGFK